MIGSGGKFPLPRSGARPCTSWVSGRPRRRRRSRRRPPEAGGADRGEPFANHCGICHSVERNGGPRQGPNLAGVFLRKAGTLPGFRYSPGFVQADFVWDDDHLDAWLTDPQQLIPGTPMRYRQADPAIRARIIAWLKEQR